MRASATPQGASPRPLGGGLEVWPEAGGREVRRSPAERWSGRRPGLTSQSAALTGCEGREETFDALLEAQ